MKQVLLSIAMVLMSAIYAFASPLTSDEVICNGALTTVPEVANEQAGFLAAFCPAAGVPDILVNLTEGTSISDQVWTQAGFFYFVSDDDPGTLVANAVPTGYPFANFVRVVDHPETGAFQDLSKDFTYPGHTVLPAGYIQVLSDIPEPGYWFLLGPAVVALGLRRLRR